MARSNKIADDSVQIYCSGKELAYVLGLTQARISQLDSDGVFSRRPIANGEMKYELAECVQAYMTKIIHGISNEDIKIRTEKAKAEAAIKKNKAIVAELEAKELQGKMHRQEDVIEIFQGILAEIRSLIMNIPGQIAVDVANSDSPAECSAIIRTCTNNLLMSMSRFKYDPAKFEERVRERQKWESAGDDRDDDDA